jgi:hypothetical protein
MDSVWGKHLEVERAQFKKFLQEKSYKIDLLDQQRPGHWESLENYLSEPVEVEPAIEAAVEAETVVEAEAENKPAPLDKEEEILMFRLAYCQSFDEYSGIRNELEAHCNDFEGRYWALLSEPSKQRICSIVAAGVAA